MASGIDGFWNPSALSITLNHNLPNYGTIHFHNVLAHESIHVAQSCFAGSINSYPLRIGLPLKESYTINESLRHPSYSKNSKESQLIEQEAYSYASNVGIAIKLLRKYC